MKENDEQKWPVYSWGSCFGPWCVSESVGHGAGQLASHSEGRCSASERVYYASGHFGHEFWITKTPLYQFLFTFDFDLMHRNYTWD